MLASKRPSPLKCIELVLSDIGIYNSIPSLVRGSAQDILDEIKSYDYEIIDLDFIVKLENEIFDLSSELRASEEHTQYWEDKCAE